MKSFCHVLKTAESRPLLISYTVYLLQSILFIRDSSSLLLSLTYTVPVETPLPDYIIHTTAAVAERKRKIRVMETICGRVLLPPKGRT